MNILVKDRIIMETTAVYWEPRIKTYGFQLERELSLLALHIDTTNLHFWGSHIERLGSLGIKFNLVFGQFHDDNALKLFFVIKAASADRLLDLLGHDTGTAGREAVYTESPVELLSFQGPHYGDRYGIAFTIFNILESRGISIVASCCSVSCVYLVLRGGMGDEVRNTLLENFEIPSKKAQRKDLSKR